MNKSLPLIAAVALIGYVQLVSAQDHGHLNVGATGTSQNDPLVFDNGPDFATNTDYVFTLVYTNAGRYAGYYQGNITMTALAATVENGGLGITNPASFGSYIFAQLISVDGPAGGQFAFWENGATSPSISLTSGTTGTNAWNLSANNGEPSTDPFGHVHGRRFTATKPGIYTVAFRAIDRSTNGLDGGPIHTPSDVLKIYFQAGMNIRSITSQTNAIHVVFGSRAGIDWQLEATSSLTDTNWAAVGAVVTGSDYFREVVDAAPIEGQKFYRIRNNP